MPICNQTLCQELGIIILGAVAESLPCRLSGPRRDKTGSSIVQKSRTRSLRPWAYPKRGQSDPPGGWWEDAADEHILELNLGSPGKSVRGEKAAWVFIVKILPTQ